VAIYLDNAAGAPLRDCARAAMAGVWELCGNPSAAHWAGRAMAARLEDAREQLAGAVGARPDEIVFTSGGTEANNLAARGLARQGAAVLASAVEHPSLASLPEAVSLGVGPDGRLSPDEVAAAVARAGERPLVCFGWVNSETGVAQDATALAAAARSADALAHCDAVQALGHLPVDFARQGFDSMALAGHKVGGPVGVGALVVRRGLTLRASLSGGEQEARRRPGTTPVALAAGFAAAADAAVGELDARGSLWRQWHDKLISRIGADVPDCRANCSQPCSPAIVNLAFAGLRADDLLLLLDQAGFACSAGSACTAGVHGPSRVLLAMGRTPDEASAALRVSFGWQTTAAEVDELIAALPPLVARARSAFD
jgi:cysteine desulfurase